MRGLVIIGSVGLVVAVGAIDGTRSPASAQTATIQPPASAPLRETLTALRPLSEPGPSWLRTDRESHGRFRLHDRHWSWLFPRTAAAPFGSDPLQRRHWWADPLLRRHWWS